jgi:hypothetical protein
MPLSELHACVFTTSMVLQLQNINTHIIAKTLPEASRPLYMFTSTSFLAYLQALTIRLLTGRGRAMPFFQRYFVFGINDLNVAIFSAFAVLIFSLLGRSVETGQSMYLKAVGAGEQ